MKLPITNNLRLMIVDYFRDTESRIMIDEYLRSQWYTSEQIREMEWQNLKRILNHAYSNVKYYQEIFNEMKIKPEDIKNMDDFRKLPILTKDIIRERGRDLLAKNMQDFKPVKKFTGGSTGHPLSFYMDRKSHSAQWATIYRQWITAGFIPGNEIVHLGGPSIVPSFTNYKKKLYQKINNWKFFSSFELDDEKMASWVKYIKSNHIEFIHGYSSSTFLLAKYCKKNNINMKFHSVITSSEPMYPEYRETIQDVFRCEVYDLYGANDGGGFAFECEKHNGLHTASEKALIEIIKEDNTPADFNESGEMIFTDFLNHAMPFIRYKVGDFATVGSKTCECGRGLPMIKNIKGRSHEFVMDGKGTRVHGAYFNRLVKNRNWINGFHVVQESKNLMVLYLKGDFNNVDHDIREMKELLEKKFIGVKIEIKKTNELPLSKSGKFTFIENKTLEEEKI